MKKFLIIAVFAFAAFFGCGPGSGFQVSSLNPQTDISQPANPVSYEMYSWNNGLDWNFAIFESATRISSYDEITNSPTTIVGVDTTIEKLLEMPRGTRVYWNLQRIKGLSLPDAKTQGRVEEAAKKAGLRLEVIAWPS